MKPMNAHHELVIHMEHTKPVEVADFVKALNGVNSLYSNYVAEHGICKEIAGVTFYNCSFNFSEGNCTQNCLRNEAEERKASKTGGVYKRMTMRVYQFCGDLGKNKANRGIIDEISEKQLALFFETDELKEQILGGDVNPTKMLYQVDVVLQTAEGEPCAYKVIALHDAMPIPPTE